MSAKTKKALSRKIKIFSRIALFLNALAAMLLRVGDFIRAVEQVQQVELDQPPLIKSIG